ncbi:mitogen-activated protein kinase kinase kinase 12 [Biomphalaria glabrata]
MHARKSRHRCNNSRGSMKDITSPLKSQSTYEASLDTQTSDKLNPQGFILLTYAKTLNFLGPATAIREYRSEDEADGQETRLTTLKTLNNNFNDVCFGCDGGCSDATYSSKCSTQVSADVENTFDLCPAQNRTWKL